MANNFLNRWSRLKSGEAVEPELKPSKDLEPIAKTQSDEVVQTTDAEDEPQLPTLEDAEKMNHQSSDFSSFMQPGVDPTVQEAALKKMFADPRFNVICQMDEYVLDPSMFAPLPASMLKRLVQSETLNLFGKKDKEGKGKGSDTKQIAVTENTPLDNAQETQTLASDSQSDLISSHPDESPESEVDTDPKSTIKKIS
jgi:hypothetical protein